MLLNLQSLVLWELCKQRNHAECVVQISQSIDKSGVPVLDDGPEGVLGGFLHVGLGDLDLATSEPLLVLFQVSFYFSELLNERVVLEDLDVLDVEVGLGVSLELFLRLTRVHTLEDAHSTEVLKTKLQSPNSVASSKILTSLALLSRLNSSTHFIFV